METIYHILTNAYPTKKQATGRPSALTPEQEIRATVIYKRRNRTEAELAETFGVSQASISRAVTRWTPRLVEALRDYVPVVDDLDPDESLIVESTLVYCGEWEDQQDLHSGKHHDTALNLQVASDLDGTLAWVSDLLPGATHDAKAITATALLDHFTDTLLIGDKGYIGLGMITPDRKPAGAELNPKQKSFNQSVNKIRSAVERAIAHLKTWRVLHTHYRRPFHTFPETVSDVIALEFFKTSFE